MDGNLTGNIREFLPIVGEGYPPKLPPGLRFSMFTIFSTLCCPLLSLGHIQVAQVPDRGEPGSSGELDFTYLFQLLEDEGYQGFVGCEYRPRGEGDTGGTDVGQGWFFPYGLRWHCLSFTAGDTVEGLRLG